MNPVNYLVTEVRKKKGKHFLLFFSVKKIAAKVIKYLFQWEIDPHSKARIGV